MRKKFYKRKSTPVLIVLFVILASVLVAQFTLIKDRKLDIDPGKSQPVTSLNNPDADYFRREENKVIVDFGNGQKAEKTLKAKTPFAALEMLASSEGFEIITKQYKYGLMVEEINRVANTPEKFWLYSVNGKPGKISADLYKLNSGDVIEWSYVNVQ